MSTVRDTRDSQHCTEGDRSQFDSGVCICPIQGVKGLEFEVVIIFNYNKIGKFLSAGSLPSAAKVNYLKLVECGKYVAMTRARDELVITYVEEEEQ